MFITCLLPGADFHVLCDTRYIVASDYCNLGKLTEFADELALVPLLRRLGLRLMVLLTLIRKAQLL